ncbi:peptidyl-tRNA hydrolase domain protein [Cordyceps fumosorosea ARSEF 2679]|uniref:Peptidyl-tRNA hydrolase domain protein n=1 Tax=Cordyceps fumosorosea (strain ARSEF 2679) TaxID=1081104 RepID=A0A162MCG6_CORFA|nr:peptidyl-tRNA hydrolase domain protein [Cordyceps fumosorosea ARSEF 2679]OAA54210.1 peptidyl-tRNA hydrolase domain protein [Cordyceps fumosorosea ARSEF 2679]
MLCLLHRGARIAATSSPRLFTHSALALQKPMPSRPKPPPDSELEESYLKGSGPGGQKINKTNSAVQIKHIPTGIVVKSQATRSRSQNRKIAREILAERLDDLRNGAESRAGVVGAVRKRRADSAAKKSRRKYRKLDEDRAAAAEEEEEGGGHAVPRTEAETRRVPGNGSDGSGHKSAEEPVNGKSESSQTSHDASSGQSPVDSTR